MNKIGLLKINKPNLENQSFFSFLTKSLMTSTEKINFRKRKVWKDFRETFKSEHDALTDKKLNRKFNLHHCDLNPSNYDDLSNRDNFLPLNSQSHDCIHFLFRYYQKDPAILDRLKEILDKMVVLNSNISNKDLFKK